MGCKESNQTNKIPKVGNGLIQFIRMGKYIRHLWVKVDESYYSRSIGAFIMYFKLYYNVKSKHPCLLQCFLSAFEQTKNIKQNLWYISSRHLMVSNQRIILASLTLLLIKFRGSNSCLKKMTMLQKHLLICS